MTARRVLPWIVLGVVVVVVLVWAAWPSGEQSDPSERAHDLAAELRCPDCESLSVADSQTSSRARDPCATFGAASRRQGQTDAEIRQAYVDRYGESILLEARGRRASACSCGACRCSCSCSVPAGSCSRSGAGSASRATAADRCRRGARPDGRGDRPRRRGRRAEADATASNSSASATSCCGRSTISSASASRAPSTTSRTDALHDDYTARGRGVIRALRDGVDTGPATPPVVDAAPGARHRRGSSAFASWSRRRARRRARGAAPGETSSGNTGVAATATPRSAQSSVSASKPAVAGATPTTSPAACSWPGSSKPTAISPARSSSTTRCVGDRPDERRGRGAGRRILYLTAGRGEVGPDQAADARRCRRRHASTTRSSSTPSTPNARFFRAIVLANEFGDFAGAQNDLQRYLVLAPNGTFADQARQLLADVTNALECTPRRTTNPKNQIRNRTEKDSPWPSPARARRSTRRSIYRATDHDRPRRPS